MGRCKNCEKSEAKGEGLCPSCLDLCLQKMTQLENDIVATRNVTNEQFELLRNLTKAMARTRISGCYGRISGQMKDTETPGVIGSRDVLLRRVREALLLDRPPMLSGNNAKPVEKTSRRKGLGVGILLVLLGALVAFALFWLNTR